MKRINVGFTLAEALVVMSILGVVAALSIPQVGYNIQKSKNALILSRSVEQVETGCQTVLYQYNDALESAANDEFGNSRFEGYSSIPSPLGNGSYMTGSWLFRAGRNQELFKFGERLTTSNLSGYTAKTYNKAANLSASSGLYSTDSSSSQADLYLSSITGAYIGIGGTFSANSSITGNGTNASSDDPIVDIIYIDVNAKSKPNELGKDIFVFGLSDRCHMFPAGSIKMRLVNYPSGASTSDSCTDSSQGTGMACAQKIVEDGYKINY